MQMQNKWSKLIWTNLIFASLRGLQCVKAYDNLLSACQVKKLDSVTKRTYEKVKYLISELLHSQKWAEVI